MFIDFIQEVMEIREGAKIYDEFTLKKSNRGYFHVVASTQRVRHTGTARVFPMRKIEWLAAAFEGDIVLDADAGEELRKIEFDKGWAAVVPGI